MACVGSISKEYNVSGITFYTSGLKFGGVLYATTGDEVSLTLGSSRIGYTVEGYEASADTLSGTASPYTLTMPSANVTINATSMTLAPSRAMAPLKVHTPSAMLTTGHASAKT